MPATKPTDARILIVDDDSDTLRLLELILRYHGFKHICATADPRQSLPLYSKFHPDLILLDLMMPGLNGLDVMKQLQDAIWEDVYLFTHCHTHRRHQF